MDSMVELSIIGVRRFETSRRTKSSWGPSISRRRERDVLQVAFMIGGLCPRAHVSQAMCLWLNLWWGSQVLVFKVVMMSAKVRLPVRGWSEIGRTTKDIVPFPESNQNLRIIIGIIFRLNYGKRTWVCSSFRRSKRDIDIFKSLTLWEIKFSQIIQWG